MELTAPRTRLIAAALTGIVTLAALGVFASGSGPGATAQTVEATPTAAASPAVSTTPVTSPTSAPTTAAPDRRTGIRPAPGAFARTVTQTDQPLPAGHGISFTNIATGVTETYTLVVSSPGEYVSYQTSEDNRWITAPNGYLHDRETGNSYS